ncbi:hypothetical protein ACF1GT_36475 [Streptomyces sp. NPDC014636]|uniref:hypothetical protein n=1 Tax=Streptomyces sp. NPDC014636 TaxID=3364876 RepID=UPI0036F706E9
MAGPQPGVAAVPRWPASARCSGRTAGLTAQAFADYRAGKLPAGPGARDLIKAFEHIDDVLTEHDPGTAAVLDSERRLEMLLRQQSKSLHLRTANYCWFRDPSKALCLKLAGTPNATNPLAGMCDSARCPQATHHPCHLPGWPACPPRATAPPPSGRAAEADSARVSVPLASPHNVMRRPQLSVVAVLVSYR